MIKRLASLTLQEMIGHYQQSPTTLFYEIADISILEFETKMIIPVSWIDDGLKVSTHSLLVMKQATFEDLIDKLKRKLNLPDREYRLFEVTYNKIRSNPDLKSVISVSGGTMDNTTFLIEAKNPLKIGDTH